MPYFLYCVRCNEDGSYSNVNINCPKCDGTGNDWRADKELSDYHKWSELTIEQLKEHKELKSPNGITFIYGERIPSVKEEREQLAKKHQEFTISEYDYYIEPCQLCISREGKTYESCGWCHDSDTFHANRDTYPGNYIKIQYGGDGYPFHDTPHLTRVYFKNGNRIEGSGASIPKDELDENTIDLDALEIQEIGSVQCRKKGQVNEFVKRYYHSNNRELKLEGKSSILTGNFDYYTLGISFSGLSDQLVESSKNVLAEMEKKYGNQLNKQVDLNALITEFPALLDLKIGEELFAHEYFHLYQTLTLGSAYKLYESSREIAYLKVIILFSLISEDYKFDIDLKETIFHRISSITCEDNRRSIESLFDMYRLNVDLLDNFFMYNREAELNIVDLLEGEAFFFQKLVNRTIDIETFSPKENSPYLKAYNIFKSQGGSELIVFLIFCNLSLKYGMLDDGDFMAIMPTPPDIFLHLCDSINELESILTPSMLSNNFFGHPSVSDKFEMWGITLKEVEKDLLNSTHLHEDEVYAVSLTCKLIEASSEKVESLFKERKVKFSVSDVSISDPRAKAIKDSILSATPAFGSDAFLAIFLVNYAFSHEFVFKEFGKHLNVEYSGLFDRQITARQEDEIYKLATEIDQLQKMGMVYCCSEHGEVSFSIFSSCSNPTSLNSRVYSFFDKSLLDLII